MQGSRPKKVRDRKVKKFWRLGDSSRTIHQLKKCHGSLKLAHNYMNSFSFIESLEKSRPDKKSPASKSPRQTEHMPKSKEKCLPN